MIGASLRIKKINALLQKELSYIIFKEAGDIRIKDITISTVDTSSNLSNSKIFIMFIVETEKEKIIKIIEALNKASGFFRVKLSQKINLRKMPKLKFVLDTSLHNVKKIDFLLKSLNYD